MLLCYQFNVMDGTCILGCRKFCDNLKLSHVIQHDIRRDACNHINTAEFIAGVFE